MSVTKAPWHTFANDYCGRDHQAPLTSHLSCSREGLSPHQQESAPSRWTTSLSSLSLSISLSLGGPSVSQTASARARAGWAGAKTTHLTYTRSGKRRQNLETCFYLSFTFHLTDFSTGNKNSASLSSLGAFSGSNSTKEMSSETLLESCQSGSRRVLQ